MSSLSGTFVRTLLPMISVGFYAFVSCSSPLEQSFHSDHRVFGINKLGPRADFIGYESDSLAIADFQVQADLDSTYTQGEFSLSTRIENRSAVDANRTLKVCLYEGSDLVFSKESELNLKAGSSKEFALESLIQEVKPWSAEDPHCYVLSMGLSDPQSHQNKQFVRKNIGFRNISIQNSQLLVNGEAIDIREISFNGTLTTSRWILAEIPPGAVTCTINTPSRQEIITTPLS